MVVWGLHMKAAGFCDRSTSESPFRSSSSIKAPVVISKMQQKIVPIAQKRDTELVMPPEPMTVLPTIKYMIDNSVELHLSQEPSL